MKYIALILISILTYNVVGSTCVHSDILKVSFEAEINDSKDCHEGETRHEEKCSCNCHHTSTASLFNLQESPNIILKAHKSLPFTKLINLKLTDFINKVNRPPIKFS